MGSSAPKKRVRPDDPRLDRNDPYLRVLCVNVFVRDQDKSLRFYVEQLGFSLVVDENYDAGRALAGGCASGWKYFDRTGHSQAQYP